MRRVLAALAAFGAGLLIAGCSSIGSTVNRLPDDAASRGFVLLPKPLRLPQSRITAECVPESLCAVINYWGKSASVEELSFYGRNPGMNGMLSTAIPMLAQKKGFKAGLVEGSVGRIKVAIDRGVPPIIGVKSSGGNFHCFVVIGYNDREQLIVCEEYQDTKRLIGYEEIEELWKPSDHLMIEIEPSRADELFIDGASLEFRGRYDEAAELYKKALELDPKHYDARVGLGNCFYFRKKLDAALEEYQKAYDENSSDPKVCNNLANVRLELGKDLPEAERLAERAVEQYETSWKRAQAALEQDRNSASRTMRQQELRDAELDLADALGTLGQARAANGRHDLAIAAWKAARARYPLTEFDIRAKRLYEIALSCRELKMPAEAKRTLEEALSEARDPDLKAKIEAALK